MTYAELLADNQRLRKRIIELEQENASLKGWMSHCCPYRNLRRLKVISH